MTSKAIDPERTTQAIMTASQSDLRKVMRALCRNNPVINKHAGALFAKLGLPASTTTTTTTNNSTIPNTTTTNLNIMAAAATTGTKRKAEPELQICIQCEDTFEEGDRRKLCWHHWCKSPPTIHLSPFPLPGLPPMEICSRVLWHD